MTMMMMIILVISKIKKAQRKMMTQLKATRDGAQIARMMAKKKKPFLNQNRGGAGYLKVRAGDSSTLMNTWSNRWID